MEVSDSSLREAEKYLEIGDKSKDGFKKTNLLKNDGGIWVWRRSDRQERAISTYLTGGRLRKSFEGGREEVKHGLDDGGLSSKRPGGSSVCQRFCPCKFTPSAGRRTR